MQPIETELAVGLESTINDPFVVRRGARGSVAVRPIRWVGAGMTLGGYPDLGTADLTGATRALTELNLIAPDVSRVIGMGSAWAEATPLSHRGEVGWALRLRVGGGGVYTVDDLELWGAEGGSAENFRRQVHPQWGWEVAAEATQDRYGLRVHVGEVWYVEVVDGVEENKRPKWLGVEGTVRLGRGVITAAQEEEE